MSDARWNTSNCTVITVNFLILICSVLWYRCEPQTARGLFVFLYNFAFVFFTMYLTSLVIVLHCMVSWWQHHFAITVTALWKAPLCFFGQRQGTPEQRRVSFFILICFSCVFFSLEAKEIQDLSVVLLRSMVKGQEMNYVDCEGWEWLNQL